MLGERTLEHISLFNEGTEAEFFDSNEEMLLKIKYYLTNEAMRIKIAKAGRLRCLTSGYGNEHLVNFIVGILNNNISKL